MTGTHSTPILVALPVNLLTGRRDLSKLTSPGDDKTALPVRKPFSGGFRTLLALLVTESSLHHLGQPRGHS